jgi:hypothetical protein
MSTCQGDLPESTKVDGEMKEYIEGEADRLGVTKAEFHRRLLDLYRESRRENVECPHCAEKVKFDLRT